jgi:type I restriction enzyme S subunit
MLFEAGGTTIKHIYISRLAKMPIAYPPLSEQSAILDYVIERAEAFDALTAEAERAIGLLQERRMALISAAVTGKIDVRGLAETGAA